ncbi:MAG TPA: Ppx/GppA phosphatase family protein, partial [Candidatus Binatia bacterium]|nr:Ppx/GppA phosphatase family protein [Candidatus Binatia bacterium]
RSAFFDVGTNTILCVIAEIRDTGRFRVLDDMAEITRLGQGVDETRRISREGEERSLAALKRYRSRCDSLGVDEIVAVGTSALRDAENSAEVCARFRDELGISIRVISGEEEAAYSFLAVRRGLSLGDGQILVIDIGGGSTEFICGDQTGISRALSVDLGSVRLTERFLYSDPVRPEEVARMAAVIERQLDRLPENGIEIDPRVALIGIAGTFTTLVAMEKKLRQYFHRDVHGAALTLDAVRRQLKRLEKKSLEERRRIASLEPQRADVIFAGAYLLERIMDRYRAERVTVSDQGVRYGLLHEAAQPL